MQIFSIRFLLLRPTNQKTKNQKNMKKSLLAFFAAGIAAVTFSISSCTVDPCKDVSCGANGECVEGDCVCDAGYEGTTCATEWRAKFIGTASLSGTVACPVSGNGTFPATAFTMSNSSQGVTMFTINGAGLVFVATTTSSTSFTIASTTINNLTYTGSGQISGTNVSITLNEQDPSLNETCIYTLTGSIQ